MANKNNRKCIVCGENYYYCSHNCTDSYNKPSWYTIFHDQNCHDIYDICTNIYPVKGKNAAKELLDKCDLSNKNNFHNSIVKIINEIYDVKINKENTNNINKNNTEEIKVNNNIKNEDKLDGKELTPNENITSNINNSSSVNSKNINDNKKNSVGLNKK